MESQIKTYEREALLIDDELDAVAGGAREASEPSVSEIVVTKRQDIASPKLFLD